MAERPDIFLKQRLTTGQMRAVAERRFDDARALCETGQNARANGAQYLTGIVIEILLKAALVDSYPGVALLGSNEVSVNDRKIWNLIWRSHDLGEMLEHLPVLKASVIRRGSRAGLPYMAWLATICGSWTIFARYSSLLSNIAEARDMIERVRILKEVLR